MKVAAAFLMSAAFAIAAQRYTFKTTQPVEVTAQLRLRSPNADWAVRGREAAVADVTLDGTSRQQIMLYGGEAAVEYRIFLGPVAVGRHELTVDRNQTYSASGAGLETDSVRFEQVSKDGPEYAALAHAPVLYARRNTIGRFSDVPMVVYAERLPAGLQYTVIFSNEDGGTSTRALMARWGRTTDIEYVYVVSPETNNAIVQGRDHRDVPFKGRYLGLHPLLMPVTDNNMIAEATESPLRFQIAPVLVDLTDATRESVMDSNPVTYTVMSKELQREGKLRPFGIVDGEKISDQRNYLFIDYRAEHQRSRFSVGVLLKNGRVFSSSLGRFDYAIGRNEWVRTTVELPPNTKPADIDALSFDCLTDQHDGVCRLLHINRVFFLMKDGLPGNDILKSDKSYTVPSGQSVLLKP